MEKFALFTKINSIRSASAKALLDNKLE